LRKHKDTPVARCQKGMAALEFADVNALLSTPCPDCRLHIRHHAILRGRSLPYPPYLTIGGYDTISVRQNANETKFFVRQFYDHDRKKRDQYLCQLETPGCSALAATWKRIVEEARDLQASTRLLAREGYSLLSAKHLATLAPLSRHKVFDAGEVLVGTHAFEVIVNRLGIRVAVFATEDVDIARPGKLALGKPPRGGLLELLRESGIDFVGVPGFKRGAPPTSFKEKGRSRLTLDLLVLTAGDEIETLPVPGLNAHATGLPYLRYLLSETQMGAAISTHGVAAVRVPLPERFALHKLIVAQLRTGRTEKSRKDLRQAAVLIAATGELFPGAIGEAFAKTPTSSRKQIRKSLEKTRPELQAHPQAWEEVARAAKLN
jgi:hypothetical protein